MKIRTGFTRKPLVIFLTIAMIFTIAGLGFSTPAKTALAVESASSDPQEAIIKQVLAETGAEFGWDQSFCFYGVPAYDGAEIPYHCPEIWGPRAQYGMGAGGEFEVLAGVAAYGLDVPLREGETVWESLPMKIQAYTTEAAAAAVMAEGTAACASVSGCEATKFHNHPAAIGDFGTLGGSNMDWQAGRFLFTTGLSIDIGISCQEIAEALYANAVKYGLIVGDGGAIPTQDSDGDGVTDDIDQCPGTSAGVAVDASGCPAGLTVTIDTDKVEYIPGETAIIRGKVLDSNTPTTGVSVTVDVSGWKGSATTDASGNYRVEYLIPPNVGQLSYIATATASYNGKTGTSINATFSVGKIGLIVAMTTDKDHYLIGDTVYCTIMVKGAQGAPVASADIQVAAKRLGSGRTTNLSGTTDALGENQWSFVWGQDDNGKTIAEGKLQIDITATKDDAEGKTTVSICGCGDLENTEEEDCLDCPEDCPCDKDEVCDPSNPLKDPVTMCSPKTAYIFISDGLSAYHRWFASDDIRYSRKLFQTLGYHVEPDIIVGHINEIAKYLSRPSTKAIAYFGHGEDPGGIPTIEAAEATKGGYSIKAAIATRSKQDGGFLDACQYGSYAAKWVENKDKIEQIAQNKADHPNLENAFIFACYSLDDYSLRDYLLESGGAFWGHAGKLPGSAYLTKTYKP